MNTREFPIERVMEQVEQRMQARQDSPLDIYVWADGRVTGPPSGNEHDEAHLVTLVTPGTPETPSLGDIRATILSGVATEPGEPLETTVPAAGLEEVEPSEAHSANGQPDR